MCSDMLAILVLIHGCFLVDVLGSQEAVSPRLEPHFCSALLVVPSSQQSRVCSTGKRPFERPGLSSRAAEMTVWAGRVE